MLDLRGKRVLFFTASFLGYQNDIRESLENSGAVVDWFDERLCDDTITKILIRLNRDYIARKINAYYDKIIESTKEFKYDYVFFVNIEAASKNSLLKIKEYHPHAKFLLYEWDSLVNNKHALNLLEDFDAVWSFDRNDCDELGINFLPLFYNNKYAATRKHTSSFKYETLFVGTLHSDRYKFVKEIERQVLDLGHGERKTFSWFYFPSKILYYKMWMENRQFRHIVKKEDLRFTALSLEQLIDLVGCSRIIIDAQHPKQTGLTMRSIEALGANRKLITTNKDIQNYDFYDPNNILIVDRKDPKVTVDFLNAEYIEVNENVYKKYSLESWLETIFDSVK